MKQIRLKQFILTGYILGILAWKFLVGGWGLTQWPGVILFVVGALIGWQMVWFDKIAFIYILHPEAQLSQQVKFYIKQKQYRRAMRLLDERETEMDKLTTRSVLFQVAWVGLGLFAVTSVANFFGRMLVMSLGLRIMVEEWEEYKADKQALNKLLFWQIKREVSDKELKRYLQVMTGLFLWLTLMVL